MRRKLSVMLAPALLLLASVPAGAQHTGHVQGAMMGGAHDSATMAEMHVVHQLLAQHEKIERTVTNLPDGIRTVTESADPAIAALLKQHVAAMDQRLREGNDPGLPMESPALRSLFRDKDRIRTTIETTEKGIIVVQTSTEATVVAALQQHASEVSDLVRGGMAAMHEAMMKNGGMMMGHGMHGGMMKRDTTTAGGVVR